jgi:alkanesulfonate monooxygenase SsuD/methylene tetrahydromethanopterin reductase-like flavin-dependent oxidoreductase (luciferase family)
MPLWAGGKGGPKLLRLAARHASGWNVVWRFSNDWYRGKLVDVERACEAEGRDPVTFRKTVGLYCLIGGSEAEAREVFERGRAAMPGNAMASDTFEIWCTETLSGTPDMALERVGALEAMGVEEIVLAPWVLPFAIPEPGLLDAAARHLVTARR